MKAKAALKISRRSGWHGASPWLSLYDYLFAWGGRPSPKALHSVLLAILVAITVLSQRHTASTQDLSLQGDGHAALSLEIAVNRVRFGAISHIDARFTPVLASQTDALALPVLSRPERTGLSTSEYVSRLIPFRNNENGLMLIMDLILRTNRNITVRGLVSTLRACHVGLIVISVGLLLYLGASPVFTLAVCALAIDMVDRVNMTHSMASYPFLLPLTLLMVVLFAFVLTQFPIESRLARASVIGFLSGLFTSFCGNLRTSYFPVCLALFLLYFAFCLFPFNRSGKDQRRKILALSILLLSFVCGNWVFDRAFIRQLRYLPVRSNPEYHVVMHPLVLGLALPANDLSKREGIQWLDTVGLTLARRVAPKVDYLTPEYEQALKTYYRGLWVSHTREMLGIYWLKLGYSAKNLIAFVHDVPKDRGALMAFTPIAAIPFELVDHGLYLLALMTALALIGIIAPKKLRLDPIALRYLLSGFAAVGLLIFLEMAIVKSDFGIIYHAPLVFGLFSASLMTYQAGANWISCVWHRSTDKIAEREIRRIKR